MNLRVFYNARTVISAPQSSPALRRLPACALVLSLAFAPCARAQQRVAPTDVKKEPGGVSLGALTAPVTLTVSGNQGRWAQVTLDGWIFGASVKPDRRQGLDLVVSERDGENLRAGPNGSVMARLRYGALLERVEERGKWVHVRRRGWVPRSALEQPKVAARPKPGAGPQPAAYKPMEEQKPDTAPARPVPASGAVVPAGATDRVDVARASAVYSTPNGGQVGTLQPGAAARVLARAGEWTRIATEVWVHDADLTAASGEALQGVSAAEVRANPERYVGQLVDWRLQLVSIQTADELRSEMPSGQTYLLTRGPLPEPGFVYVMIPRDQGQRFRALGPLSELTLRLRIRAARSKYLATPVAELVAVVDSAAAR
jgi:hypothetical protein